MLFMPMYSEDKFIFCVCRVSIETQVEVQLAYSANCSGHCRHTVKQYSVPIVPAVPRLWQLCA